MKATDLLLAAYAIARAKDDKHHEQWISVSFKLGAIAGAVHTISVQRIGRLDMLLRLLEDERLERLKDGPSNEPDWALDLQFALSESWLLSAYEVTRTGKEMLKRRSEEMPKLLSLENRLALVRMPIAKGEIQGMNQKANRDNPPMLVRAGSDTPEPYQADGSFIMPKSLCEQTGSVLWHPIDMSLVRTIAIRRLDLSNEMLSLFDCSAEKIM